MNPREERILRPTLLSALQLTHDIPFWLEKVHAHDSIYIPLYVVQVIPLHSGINLHIYADAMNLVVLFCFIFTENISLVSRPGGVAWRGVVPCGLRAKSAAACAWLAPRL